MGHKACEGTRWDMLRPGPRDGNDARGLAPVGNLGLTNPIVVQVQPGTERVPVSLAIQPTPRSGPVPFWKKSCVAPAAPRSAKLQMCSANIPVAPHSYGTYSAAGGCLQVSAKPLQTTGQIDKLPSSQVLSVAICAGPLRTREPKSRPAWNEEGLAAQTKPTETPGSGPASSQRRISGTCRRVANGE
jgi:hypothetical protein